MNDPELLVSDLTSKVIAGVLWLFVLKGMWDLSWLFHERKLMSREVWWWQVGSILMLFATYLVAPPLASHPRLDAETALWTSLGALLAGLAVAAVFGQRGQRLAQAQRAAHAAAVAETAEPR